MKMLVVQKTKKRGKNVVGLSSLHIGFNNVVDDAEKKL